MPEPMVPAPMTAIEQTVDMRESVQKVAVSMERKALAFP
jgi:hypothetical protein